jgi:hypothetical protein
MSSEALVASRRISIQPTILDDLGPKRTARYPERVIQRASQDKYGLTRDDALGKHEKTANLKSITGQKRKIITYSSHPADIISITSKVV